MSANQSAGATAAPALGAKPPRPDAIESEKLLHGKHQLAILHNNEVYVLRQTRLGKLILTK